MGLATVGGGPLGSWPPCIMEHALPHIAGMTFLRPQCGLSAMPLVGAVTHGRTAMWPLSAKPALCRSGGGGASLPRS